MRSPQLEELVRMLQGRLNDRRDSPDDDRLSYERMMARFPMDEDIATQRVNAGGVPAEWIDAPGADQSRVLMYLHGGGYVIGSMRTHRTTLGRISRAAGVRVLGLDFRLAPENPFPAALEDSVSSYQWLLSQGFKSSGIAFAGESAGGGLVVSTLVALRYLGEPMPAAGIGGSSWADLEQSGASMVTNAEVDPSVTSKGLWKRCAMYMGGKDPRAPLASPVHADLTGLPPLLLMVGSVEVLVDDSTRLAEKGREAGVDVTLEVWDDMPHNWHTFAPMLPEGQRAIERMSDHLRRHMS